ncbi:hypothetical protein CFIO01_06289 [Colletotrichum fioriniae PJ7]|uniref:Uncharacterized protein n=1 Tax=Colletotrichum fioriniae PJ7 TaxID=1445577 RepID=A0A010RTE9_9PEZI|nr:hypothetical protein CFIO01_06289 [Colletotrichum fioriniae PJ7]
MMSMIISPQVVSLIIDIILGILEVLFVAWTLVAIDQAEGRRNPDDKPTMKLRGYGVEGIVMDDGEGSEERTYGGEGIDVDLGGGRRTASTRVRARVSRRRGEVLEHKGLRSGHQLASEAQRSLMAGEPTIQSFEHQRAEDLDCIARRKQG